MENIKNEINKTRLYIVIAIMATIAMTLYLISIKLAYPVFQNARLLDPLAEIHSLFPLYYIALIVMTAAGVLCIVYRVKNPGIHIVLLLLMAIMIWYTKYYLAGFTWEPDGPRNLGIALKLPEIVEGFHVPGSEYAAQYPISYILEYIIANASGASYLVYFHLMPLINVSVFVLLIYVFIYMLFNPRIAFLTTIISIIGIHYMIFIMGAHTTGVLLLLTALILVFKTGIIWRILTFLLIILIVITHPISPIILGVFLGSIVVANISRYRIKSQILVAGMLCVCMLGWYFWPIITPHMSIVVTGLEDNIVPEDLNNAYMLTMGKAFIYSSISTLNRIIYAVYGLMVLLSIGLVFLINYRKSRNIRSFILEIGGLSRKRLFLIIAAPLLLIVAILLAERTPDLMERGLTMAIISISGIIASITCGLYNPVKRWINRLVVSLSVIVLLFLAMSFPIVSYSIDAYSSFPISERNGLEFTAEKVNLENKILADTSGHQSVLFEPEVKEIRSIIRNSSIEQIDVFIIRSTGYYYAEMRFDFSFKDNRISRFKDSLSNSTNIIGIYTSPTVSVYIIR
jgi:hypothetical protein